MPERLGSTEIGPEGLFEALPRARTILEIGCCSVALARAYKAVHPHAHWTVIGSSADCSASAFGDFDRLIVTDPHAGDLAFLEGPFDLIVLNDVVERAPDPRRFLKMVRALIEEDGKLVCCIRNACNIAAIERCLLGELAEEGSGASSSDTMRMFSPSSVIKVLLDAGWSPNLLSKSAAVATGTCVDLLQSAAEALGSSSDAFNRTASLTELVFDCKPIRRRSAVSGRIKVSVIVPVTNQLQYGLNIASSPALRELDAELIPIYEATSAADGFERGREVAKGDWLIYCHQDIYLPEGSGHAIAAELLAVREDVLQEVIIGMIGLAEMTKDRVEANGTQFSGAIIDRIMRLDFEPTDNAISIDESCVIVHRTCRQSIDASMGWHLWATDLVLAARANASHPPCRTINVPIFHNSLTGWALPGAFDRSIRRLFDKYPESQQITSLCGNWTRSSLLK